MNNQPAFYAVNPDAIVDQLWPLIEAKFAAMQDKPVQWLKVKEVAAKLSMSPDHVLRLIDEGVIPAKDFATPGASRAEWRVRDCDLNF